MTDINNFKNKTFNCDNKEIFQQLPDNSIDLIITDPPYKDYQSNRPVVHEKVKKIHEYDFALPYFIEQSARVLKPGCHFYCWCDHISFPNIFLQLEQHKEKQKKKKTDDYLLYKNCLIWIKNNHGSGDLIGDYAPQHEFVIFATKGKGKPLNGQRQPNVYFRKTKFGIEFYKKVSNYKFDHGTIKPVDILRLQIEKSSNVGDLIFDPYAGSMSLGEACILTDRNYLLVEIVKEHYEAGNKRLNSIPKQLNL